MSSSPDPTTQQAKDTSWEAIALPTRDTGISTEGHSRTEGVFVTNYRFWKTPKDGHDGTTQRLVNNRYRIVRPLGGGGMAEVYLAHDEVLGRDVALKTLHRRYVGDEEFVERFRREARNAASLSHPHVVPVFDWGESGDGTYYIAMEYMSGARSKSGFCAKGVSLPGWRRRLLFRRPGGWRPRTCAV